MKIIGTSFSRTGTYTLKLALEQLGKGLCYHMYEFRKRPDDLALFQEAFETGSCNWEMLYKEFNSLVDWPSSYFWETLYRVYPDAKFIHIDRDPEAWYNSIIATVFPSIFEDIKSHDSFKRERNQLLKRMILETMFEGRFDDKAFVIRKYLDHREKVKNTIPKSQILFFRLEEEWAPLCNFFDLPLPDQEFPNTNTKKAFWDYYRQ